MHFYILFYLYFFLFFLFFCLFVLFWCCFCFVMLFSIFLEVYAQGAGTPLLLWQYDLEVYTGSNTVFCQNLMFMSCLVLQPVGIQYLVVTGDEVMSVAHQTSAFAQWSGHSVYITLPQWQFCLGSDLAICHLYDMWHIKSLCTVACDCSFACILNFTTTYCVFFFFFFIHFCLFTSAAGTGGGDAYST